MNLKRKLSRLMFGVKFLSFKKSNGEITHDDRNNNYIHNIYKNIIINMRRDFFHRLFSFLLATVCIKRLRSDTSQMQYTVVVTKLYKFLLGNRKNWRQKLKKTVFVTLPIFNTHNAYFCMHTMISNDCNNIF